MSVHVIGVQPDEIKSWVEFKNVDGKEYRREIVLVITDWKECGRTPSESEHHGKRG